MSSDVCFPIVFVCFKVSFYGKIPSFLDQNKVNLLSAEQVQIFC